MGYPLPTVVIAIIAFSFWPILFFLMWKIDATRLLNAEKTGDITVIIPVRNEEFRIQPLLESLQCQARKPERIIFVDDHSTDETCRTIAQAGFEFHRLEEAGAEYSGKAMACWYGASLAETEYLLFLDADVVLAPDGIKKILKHAAGGNELLSFQPFHRTSRKYESLSSFFTLVTLASLDCFTPRSGEQSATGSFGPCIICRRDTYQEVGGHLAVKDEIVDDMSLNRLFRSRGIPAKSYMGGGIAEYRMYPGGLVSLIEGWTKNIAPGAEFIKKSSLGLIILWITGCVNSILLFFLPIDWMAPLKVAAISGYILYSVQLFFYYRKLGKTSVWTALLYPIQMVFFLVIFFRSLISFRIKKKIVWKNRVLRVR